MSNKKDTIYLESKPKYEILDGLRGVAAMLVVATHLFETYASSHADQIINHGYLAVDFFFLLSGFVIGYAYDDRWGKMSTWGFFKRRLVRLQPMVIMGSLIGAALFYFGDCKDFPLINQTPWWQMMLLCLLGCTMIPASKSMDIRGWQETYPLNGPQWSLFLEYCANIAYALVFRHLGKVATGVLVGMSAVLTVDLGLSLDLFGLLPDGQYAKGTFIGGWGIEGTQLYIAIVRLCYPFLCGLLISRVGKFIRVKGGFWWCSLALALLMGVPHIGAAEETTANGIYETVCILLFFPAIVATGAGSRITGKRTNALCKWLADISYPLYITHFPLILMQKAWMSHHADLPAATHVAVAIGTYILSVAIAYAALKLYDEPTREWLKRKVLHKHPGTKAKN